MTPGRPEDALTEARERARAARERGEYGDAEELAAIGAEQHHDVAKLHEWAFIEVDPETIYSTRRLGAPITALKRGLMRLLVQYHNEVTAQQTRFNLHLLGQVARLERRVAQLEQRSREEQRR